MTESRSIRLTYDFTLREGVTFTNGSAFAAEDTRYSFDHLLNPDYKAARRPVFARIKPVDVLSPTGVLAQGCRRPIAHDPCRGV